MSVTAFYVQLVIIVPRGQLLVPSIDVSMELIEAQLVLNAKILVLLLHALNHVITVLLVNIVTILFQLMGVIQVSSRHVIVQQDIIVLQEQNISTSFHVTMEHTVLTQKISHKITVKYVQMVIGVVQA